MTYRVSWRTEAENQLAELWMVAPDREAVARYAHALDQSLQLDPHGQGESRDGGTRVAFPRPLSVRYLIDDAARTVTVISIGWAGY